eukprot:364743-Chlamydomonas_euryale.AAC.72
MQEVCEQYVGLGTYAKPIADAEEARVRLPEHSANTVLCVLLNIGYIFLDVRTDLETEQSGKLRNCVHVPFRIAKKRWDSDQGKSVVTVSDNENFLRDVMQKIPDKSKAALLVADADGRSGGMEALEVLDRAGYENLVGVVGGFRKFWRVWDAKLARRPARGAFREDPWSNGSSQGIFAGES